MKSHDFSYRFEAAGVSAIIATQDDGICEAVEQAERESHPLPLKCAVNGARSGWQDLSLIHIWIPSRSRFRRR